MNYRAAIVSGIFLLINGLAFGQKNADSTKVIVNSAHYPRKGGDTIVTITAADLKGLKPLSAEELSKAMNGRLCSCDSLNRAPSKTIKPQERRPKSK